MKLVIFDCDGTLIDSQHAIVAAIGEAFSSFNLPVPPRSAVTSIIGLSLLEAFSVLAPDLSPDEQAKLAAHYKVAFTAQRQANATQEPLFPGVSDVILTLRDDPDVALAIATGKSRPGVDRLVRREGWHGVFDSIQTADHHPSKPHPSMIFHALQETGADAFETVMIGDTTFDMDMALAAGVKAIGVGWGYHPVTALEHSGAHTITLDAQTLLNDIFNLISTRSETVG